MSKSLPFQSRDGASYMGDPRRGAALGRTGARGEPQTLKFTLRRVPIDSGGYDQGGAYCGIGDPLYYFESDDGEASGYFRIGFAERMAARDANPTAYDTASDRRRFAAKHEVRTRYEGARFYV